MTARALEFRGHIIHPNDDNSCASSDELMWIAKMIVLQGIPFPRAQILAKLWRQHVDLHVLYDPDVMDLLTKTLIH